MSGAGFNQWCEQSGYTSACIGVILGVAPRTVRRWREGTGMPSAALLEALRILSKGEVTAECFPAWATRQRKVYARARQVRAAQNEQGRARGMTMSAPSLLFTEESNNG